MADYSHSILYISSVPMDSLAEADAVQRSDSHYLVAVSQGKVPRTPHRLIVVGPVKSGPGPLQQVHTVTWLVLGADLIDDSPFYRPNGVEASPEGVIL